MKNEQFNFILLLAGTGTRLLPYTRNKPKCLVEIHGKTLLERQLQIIDSLKIEKKIIFVGGYKYNLLPKKYDKLFVNNNFATTNMLSSLFCAIKELKGNVIISYGDIVYSKKMLVKLIKQKENIVVPIDINWKKYWKKRFKNPLDDAETLNIDKDGYLREIGQKPSSFKEIDGQYLGLIKLNRNGCEIFSFNYNLLKEKGMILDKDLENAYLTDFLQFLIKNNYNIKALKTKELWVEIDNVKDLFLKENYLRLQEILIKT